MKNADQTKVPSQTTGTTSKFEKKMPDKTKQVDLDNTTTTKTPDLDPNTPATNKLPETNKVPEANSSDLKKVDTDLGDGNANKLDSKVDTKTDPPKDPQVANGEKPPKSQILEDDPNLKDKDLDNLKKYEDDVDASTKKKMEDDADSDVKKGKDHDSKAAALVMARVIVATNDKIDMPIPALMAELAPLKAMKGVKDFEAEKKGNGKFEIYLIASKIKAGNYDIDPEKEDKGDENDNIKNESEKKKYTDDFYHGKKPEYINPGHHDKNNPAFRGGGASKTELLPENHEELWKRAIPGANELETKQGIPSTWYSIDEKGKIHQFQIDHNGFSHWAGSENGPSGIKLHNTTRKRLQEYYKDFLK